MNIKSFAISIVVVFIFLMLVNALIAPIIFPDGLVQRSFTNARPENLVAFHMIGLAATTILLTLFLELYSKPDLVDGLVVGSLLALIVALPENLHTYAMVETTLMEQMFPVGWALVTWGLAGGTVGFIRSKLANGT